MAGLIDVSILKPGLAGATYREAEQAKQQTELNQIKLEQLKQDAIALKDLRVKMRAAGQSDDPNVFFRALIQTGKPEYMEKGYEGLRRYEELRRNESMLRSLEPDLFAKPGAGAPTAGAGAPTAAAPATGAGAPTATNALAPTTAETPDINALRRRLFALSSINDPRAKAMAEVVKGQINEFTKSITVAPGGTVVQGGKPIYTAPAALTPVARLMAFRDSLPVGSADRLAVEAEINKEIAGNRVFDPSTGLLIDRVTGQPVAPGAAPAGQPGIAPAGQPVVTPTARPPLDMMQSPAFQELVRRGVVSTPQEAAALAQAMSLDAAGKPVNITVPNAMPGAASSVNALAGAAPTGVAPSGLTPVLQRKLGEQKLEAEYAPAIEYGKQFAQTQVKRDMDLADIAGQATRLAESANRIIGLAQQGNILTGPAANIKLNIARALNVTGADNSQLISNTEKLIAATGQSTLDAIKGAGLGTGQGFTDKDLKFLQGVAGGTIGLTRETIIELAQIQHKAAVKSAEKWNKRVKEIPENARAAANLSTEPIIIPPLLQPQSAGAKAPRPAGAGADWVLMNDAKGNRAWVSPDKTKFIEVK